MESNTWDEGNSARHFGHILWCIMGMTKCRTEHRTGKWLERKLKAQMRIMLWRSMNLNVHLRVSPGFDFFCFKERSLVLSLKFWELLWQQGRRQTGGEGGGEGTGDRETSRNLERDDEALDVSSVFCCKGPSFTPQTTVNAPAACPPTQHRHNQDEELWCFYANTNSSVSSGKWGLLKGGMLLESLSLVSSGPLGSKLQWTNEHKDPKWECTPSQWFAKC